MYSYKGGNNDSIVLRTRAQLPRALDNHGKTKADWPFDNSSKNKAEQYATSHLHGLAQVVAPPLLVYDKLIDLPEDRGMKPRHGEVKPIAAALHKGYAM